MEQLLTAPQLFLVDLSVHSCVNHVLIGLRPEMAVKPEFTK